MSEPGAIVDIYSSIHKLIDQLLQLPPLSLEKDTVLRENDKVSLRLKSVEQATSDNSEAQCMRGAANKRSRYSVRHESGNGLHHSPSALDAPYVPLASAEREIENDSRPSSRRPSLPTSQPLTWSASAPLETDVELFARCPELAQCSGTEGSAVSTPLSSIHSSTPDPRSPSPSTSSVFVPEEHATECRSNARQSLQRSGQSSSQANQGRKRRCCEAEETRRFDETFDSVVHTFGAEKGLEDFERLVIHAKESTQLIPAVLITRNFLSIPNADPMTFVQAVPDLVEELEDTEFAECLVQFKKRMALAHFYRAYRSAQTNWSMFIDWTENMRKHTNIKLTPCKGRRPDSVVKQRFIDLSIVRSKKTREQMASDISNWQSWGKQWAELIDRFGYAGLLLVPQMMTND